MKQRLLQKNDPLYKLLELSRFHDPRTIKKSAIDSTPTPTPLPPTTTATFDNETYYYISQTAVRNVAFQNPRVVDRRILAIYFGDDGRVSNIANYGLQDGRVFDFISRTTPTGGADQSFIQQVLAGVVGLGPSLPR